MHSLRKVAFKKVTSWLRENVEFNAVQNICNEDAVFEKNSNNALKI